jgi:hypothetical protein
MPNSNELVEKFKPDWRGAAFTILIALYAIFSMVRVSEFLYFNF